MATLIVGKGCPSLRIQRVLFYMPYSFVLLTSILLLATNARKAYMPVGFYLGCINLTLFVGYVTTIVGNHYLKILSFGINLAGLLVLAVVFDFWSAAIVVAAYWIPATIFVFISLLLPSISEIVPQQIYVSNACAAASSFWPEKFGITHILDLTGKTQHKNSAVIKRLRVSDHLGSHGSLDAVTEEAHRFVKSAIDSGGSVLIHCYAGHSRSAAFSIYFLMKERGMPLNEAYTFVQMRRPCIDVSTDHMPPLHLLDSEMKGRW